MFVLSLLAVALFALYLYTLLARGAAPSWIWPALASAGFFAWSLYAVIVGGPLGFWTEHVRNAWGVQIWMDLLLAIAVALTALVPAARAQGMRVIPWVAFVCCTGSIGVLAMAARLLWLRQAATS